jgi:hypothetical protein
MKHTTIQHKNDHAHYFALVSGHVVALTTALVFGLTIYAQIDPVFRRTMAFMFMPTVNEAQTQVANALGAFGF